MMYDDKLVIVEMDTMTTYGFAEKGETADEAIQRANQYYTNDLKTCLYFYFIFSNPRLQKLFSLFILALDRKSVV